MILPDENDKIPVGISSCLLGEEVRYDGGHKHNSTISNILGQHFRFIPFCPEVDIGLGVPREPIQLVVVDDQIRCRDVKTDRLDVTDRLINCADQQRDWMLEISGYILKRGSPSCGIRDVKLWREGSVEPVGIGIYADRITHNFPSLPVEDEERLEDETIKEDFIRRVRIYHRSR